MLGYTAYLASLCPGCKQPRDRAWHPEMEGWWHVATGFCQACKALGHSDESATYPFVMEDPAAATENPTTAWAPIFHDPDDLPTTGRDDPPSAREEASADG